MIYQYPQKLPIDRDICFIGAKTRSFQNEKGLSIETAYFKTVFSLEEKCSSVITISAISRYALYVNGKEAAHGPCQGSQDQYYCDRFDISDYLISGKNVISVKVVSFPPLCSNIDGVLGPYNTIGASCGPCLFVWGECIHNGKTVTDYSTGIADWYVMNDQAVSWHKEENTRLGAFEDVQGSLLPHGWISEDLIRNGFEPAVNRWSERNVFDPGCPAWGRISPYPLYLREVKMQKETEKGFLLHFKTDLSSYEEIVFPPDKGPVLLKGNGSYAIDLVTDKLCRGYLKIHTEKGKGGKVSVIYSESYATPIRPEERTEKISVNTFDWKGDRLDHEHFGLHGYTDVFYPGDGDEIYEPFMERTFRIVRILIETEEDMFLYRPFYIETSYPLELCVKETLTGWRKEIWDMSIHTLKEDMSDCFEEVSYYEATQYCLDAGFILLYLYSVSKEYCFARKVINDFASSVLPDASMQSRYPCNKKQVLFNYPHSWIMMLWEYYLETGDEDTLYRYRNTLNTVNDWYLSRLNEDGLLYDENGYTIFDWTLEWNCGRPHCAFYGPCTLDSLLYIRSLAASSKIMAILGFEDSALKYDELRKRIISAVNRHCFDEKKDYFTDGPGFSDYFSETTQALAVLAGVVEGDRAKDFLKKMIKDTELKKGGFPTRFYLFRALEKHGMYDLSEGEWDIWKEFLGKNLTTVPEQPGMSRGDSAGWAAAMLYEYTRCFLGIYAYEPGYKTIGIKPLALYMGQVSGSYETPESRVSVDWKISDNVFRIRISQTGNVPLVINMPDGNVHSTSERAADLECLLNHKK